MASDHLMASHSSANLSWFLASFEERDTFHFSLAMLYKFGSYLEYQKFSWNFSLGPYRYD